MNYAFTTYSCPDLSLEEALALAKRTGYVGVELRMGAQQAHGVEMGTDATERSAIRHRIELSGIAACCLGASARYADPASAQDGVAETHSAIDLAADIGAPLVRVFGGVIPEGVGRDDARERIISALCAVANHAAERGVIVCIETHDDWSNPEEAALLMKGVDHQAVGLVWDIMHPVRTGGATIATAYATLRPWIRHVHIHDGSSSPDRREFTPIGTGDYDHRQVLELLCQDNYTGFLSGEWISGWMEGWEPMETYLLQELATMHRYEQEQRGQR